MFAVVIDRMTDEIRKGCLWMISATRIQPRLKVPKAQLNYLGSTVQSNGDCSKEVKKWAQGRLERMKKSIGVYL